MSNEILGIHHVTAIAGDPQRNRRFLRRAAGSAAGEADRQLRRPRHLPPLLRRRAGTARDDPHVLSLARGAAAAAAAPGRPTTVALFGARRPPSASGSSGSCRAASPFEGPAPASRRGGARLPRSGRAPARAGRPHPEATRSQAVAATVRSRPSTRSAGSRRHDLPRRRAGAYRRVADRDDGLPPGRRGRRPLRVSSRPGRAGQRRGRASRCPARADGRMAVGTVHHVAWRTAADDAEQVAWRERLAGHGLQRHAGHRPPVLPLDLLPRAGRRALRDRHRRARLRRGREPRAAGRRISSCRPGWSPSALASRAALPPLRLPELARTR